MLRMRQVGVCVEEVTHNPSGIPAKPFLDAKQRYSLLDKLDSNRFAFMVKIISLGVVAIAAQQD